MKLTFQQVPQLVIPNNCQLEQQNSQGKKVVKNKKFKTYSYNRTNFANI